MASSEPTRSDGLADPYHEAEFKVKEIIDTLFELGITVQDFQASSGPVVQSRIADLITKFSQLDALKDSLEDGVPLDVLSCIEEGKNPDLLTKEVVDQAAAENQFTNGKQQTMAQFNSVLLNELAQTMPEETQAYRDLKRNSSSS
ncbi:RNA polymerase II mediator complex subunit [Tieghemiomyces parasiticus]|uniref:Mediator of RNA polymerase II transcription subunit 10 n=1 Tax=Tieghemiomyces parasiticus TaxID=78921 RepID=A0A9W8E0K5_9FUNG|nr:RNA polymerase II mediator complex subunit [Tieghemiomyces parasiticus]